MYYVKLLDEISNRVLLILLNSRMQKNEYKIKLIIPQSNLELRYIPHSNVLPLSKISSNLPVQVGTGWRGRGTATARRLRSIIHRIAFNGTKTFVALLFVVTADFDCGSINRCGLVIVRACGIPSWICESRTVEIMQIDRRRERGRPALIPLLRDADAVRRASLVLARRVPCAVGYAATINGGRDVHSGCARAHHPWTPQWAPSEYPRVATWCMHHKRTLSSAATVAVVVACPVVAETPRLWVRLKVCQERVRFESNKRCGRRQRKRKRDASRVESLPARTSLPSFFNWEVGVEVNLYMYMYAQCFSHNLNRSWERERCYVAIFYSR